MSSTLKLVYFVNFGHFGQKRPPPPAEFRGRQQCKGRHQRIKATAIVSTVGIFAFCAKAATTATGRVPKKSIYVCNLSAVRQRTAERNSVIPVVKKSAVGCRLAQTWTLKPYFRTIKLHLCIDGQKITCGAL